MTVRPATTQRNEPVTITITGAAGQIGYAMAFRVAAGAMFGSQTPVRLRLLEVPQAMRAAEGLILELDDCAFPLLASVDVFDNAAEAFAGTSVAVLVGARPRTAGMERSDLLAANAGIFGPQGKAINDNAADDVRVVVVGNPANTNALITAAHAPDIPTQRFSALTRLDHNRALAQLSHRLGVDSGHIRRLTIWGNHSSTQYPDLSNVTVDGRGHLPELSDRLWLKDEFIPRVANRGAEVIEVRGASSAASAANAIIDHVHDWAMGTPEGDWTSVALLSQGEYGTPSGVFFSFPATSDGKAWTIPADLELSEFTRGRLALTAAELVSERDAVRALGFV